MLRSRRQRRAPSRSPLTRSSSHVDLRSSIFVCVQEINDSSQPCSSCCDRLHSVSVWPDFPRFKSCAPARQSPTQQRCSRDYRDSGCQRYVWLGRRLNGKGGLLRTWSSARASKHILLQRSVVQKCEESLLCHSLSRAGHSCCACLQESSSAACCRFLAQQ